MAEGDWSPWFSMELDDEDKLDLVTPIPMPEKPDYPPGLMLTFNDRIMKKIDLDNDVDVGDVIVFRAVAEVKHVDKSESGCCVCLQITDMQFREDSDGDYDGD